jgi:hypothetical protein
MDDLFGATRNELELSNVLLSITLDEALSLCKGHQLELAREREVVFAGLFDRLAVRLCHVIRTIRDHGSSFGTLPNVSPLAPGNFRGATAQRISFMSNMLAKVLFHQRTRFFHKLYSLNEVIEELQDEAKLILSDMSEGTSAALNRAWQELEVLCYDLNTCMGETTVILKSFFCALPADELEAFRQKLVSFVPALRTPGPRLAQAFHRK